MLSISPTPPRGGRERERREGHAVFFFLLTHPPHPPPPPPHSQLLVAVYDHNAILADSLLGSGAIKIPKASGGGGGGGMGDASTRRIELYDKSDKHAGVLTLVVTCTGKGEVGGAGMGPATPAAVAAGGGGRRALSETRRAGSPARRAESPPRGRVVSKGAVIRGEPMGGGGGGMATGGMGGGGTTGRRSPSPTFAERTRDTLSSAAARVTGDRVGGDRGDRASPGRGGPAYEGDRGGGLHTGGGFERERGGGFGTTEFSRSAQTYTPPPGAVEGPADGILIERRLLTAMEDRVKIVERVQQVTVATPVEKRFVVETRYVGERAGPPHTREGAITERIVREDAPADLAAGKPELRLKGGGAV